VLRQREHHLGARLGAEPVDEQVRRLGHPVVECLHGELDAFARGVVIEGDERAGGFGGQCPAQQVNGMRHESED
jgi:hypothetical protein